MRWTKWTWWTVMIRVLMAGDVSGADWVVDTAAAPWFPRDSCGAVVFQNKLWLLGGWRSSYELGPTDVWSSRNGSDWLLVTNQAGWTASDYGVTLVHADLMWYLGGWYGGRLTNASASSEVWNSIDGARWERVQATPHPNSLLDRGGEGEEKTGSMWCPRAGAAGVVFRGRMWVMGGTPRYLGGETNALLNDVWSSWDGVDWRLVRAEAEWAPRAFHRALVFHDRIWVMGGGCYDPVYEARNDVWSSGDGVTWRLETAHAGWGPRIWHGAAVFQEEMWVLGGWSSEPGAGNVNWADVWRSEDGRQWRQDPATGFTGGHAGAVWVTPDSIGYVAESKVVEVQRSRLYYGGGTVPPLGNSVRHRGNGFQLKAWLE